MEHPVAAQTGFGLVDYPCLDKGAALSSARVAKLLARQATRARQAGVGTLAAASR
jgi:hypothetical protein